MVADAVPDVRECGSAAPVPVSNPSDSDNSFLIQQNLDVPKSGARLHGEQKRNTRGYLPEIVLIDMIQLGKAFGDTISKRLEETERAARLIFTILFLFQHAIMLQLTFTLYVDGVEDFPKSLLLLANYFFRTLLRLHLVPLTHFTVCLSL